MPRRVVVGGVAGERRSTRRGTGNDVVGSRPYRAGDPIRAIDWPASARLSAAQDRDAFVVREFFADESPRVVVVVDQGPSMQLYEAPFPWLSKRGAALGVADAVAVSAAAARSSLGLATARGVLPPGRHPPAAVLRELRDGAAGELRRSLQQLLAHTRLLTPGSFVFVVSDFVTPPASSTWARLRAAGAEVVPVVVQDPVWEQSFPRIGGVTVTFVDPDTGEPANVRIGARDARRHAVANEARLSALLRSFRQARADPVLVGSSATAAIDGAFAAWAERRRRMLRPVA